VRSTRAAEAVAELGSLDHLVALDSMSDLPSLDEARGMIRDLDLPWSQHCFAASVITNSTEATYDDLLACLRIRGLPAELAACSLYLRTRRPRKNSSIESFCLDHDDWEKYLRDEIHEV
jgi:hypothetical protein